MGLKYNSLAQDYLKGALLGIAVIAGIIFLTKPSIFLFSFAISPDLKNHIFTFLLSVIAICAQTFSEEALFRGYIFGNIASEWGIAAGFIISSLTFSIFHLWNVNFSPLLFISFIVFGIFGCVYRIRVSKDDIIGISGFHAGWNLLIFTVPYFFTDAYINKTGEYFAICVLILLIAVIFIMNKKKVTTSS
jgi:membrane protease YdiL (CAAX protease family)